MKKAVIIIKNILKWFLYGFLISLVLLTIYKFISIKVMKQDYSSVFGYSTFEVISGSMSPSIEKYDIILVKIKDEFKVNDVITFKDEGSIITHRVTEIRGDTIITQGDANNTIDRPVKRDKIIGRVVYVLSQGSVWINILKTPKVLFAILFTIGVVVFTLKEFARDYNNKEKKRGDSMLDRIKSNNKLKIQIIIFIILLILLSFLIPYTLSRFKTEARGSADIDIAFYLLNDEYQHQSLSIENFEPGMTREYNFSVANYKDSNRSEVTLEYDLELITTTNLPLEYKVYKVENSIPTLLNLEDNLITDTNGTYFKKVNTDPIVLPHTDDLINYYRVDIKFPEEYKNYKYQGVPEHIEIKVNSRQVV